MRRSPRYGQSTGDGSTGLRRRLRAIGVVAALAVSALPAAADDFGFDQLARVIVSATSGAPALVPFIERPVLSEAELAGPPSAFGYLGSVTNPRIAYDRRGKTSFYRAETDNKCNPDNFAFPPGQAGLQKIAYSSFFKFEVKAGELTVKGASPGEKVFSLSPFEARILRRITVTISDLKEYTLDFRLLKRRVAQVAAEPECADFKHALTKVFEGKVSVTYYFEAGADVSAQFDLANTINLKLGLSVVSQTGQSQEKPNELSFDSAPRIFAARFRPVSEIIGTTRIARR